jgi:hypothetical protein
MRFRLSLACIRRFQLRARLGPSWPIGDSPRGLPRTPRGTPPSQNHTVQILPQRVRQADSPPLRRVLLLVRGR